MPLDNRSQSNASIEQSVKLPDYFSCRNCQGWQWNRFCGELRSEGSCAKQLLKEALKSGAVQIVMHVPAALPPGGAR